MSFRISEIESLSIFIKREVKKAEKKLKKTEKIHTTPPDH